MTKHIWAPWRMKYIQNQDRPHGCIFCNMLTQEDGPINQIIIRGYQAFVLLNRYPYSSGHLMVVPNRHIPSLSGLDPEIRAEMMELANQSTQVLDHIYHPEGFNLGVNIGKAAGAGIAEHIHMHIVPRWNGDTNFMSTVGDIRVIPESIDDTYRRITETWHFLFISK